MSPTVSQKLPGILSTPSQLITLVRTLAQIATGRLGNVVFYLEW